MWADNLCSEDPGFFDSLAQQQAPEYLWIGCADSRVPANQIVDLPPGTIFVHRNIANVVVHTDLNCLSVLHYAIEVLKINHVIVCGHYGCGGIAASMEREEHGMIDNWLCHIRDVARFHADKLAAVTEEEREDLLCELNVVEQVKNVCNTSVIQRAWNRGREVYVHGWIYDIKNGILKDLDTRFKSNAQVEQSERDESSVD